VWPIVDLVFIKDRWRYGATIASKKCLSHSHTKLPRAATENDIEIVYQCPLCTAGSLPSINGAHKCTICKTPVHAIPSCSSHIEGDETLRICKKCSEIGNVNLNENNAMET